MIRLKVAFTCFLLLSFVGAKSQPLKPTMVENLSINSEYAELGVKFYKNGKVIFASSKINKTSKKRDRRNNRHMGLRLYTGGIAEDGSIFNVTAFSDEENNPILEANLTFTSDYKTVYFTRNNYILDDYRKFFKKDSTESHILKIYKATINTNGQLSNVTSLPINSSSYSVTNPVLNNSGTKLYFSSNMQGTKGGFDLYAMSINRDGTYGKPINLGEKVNTRKNELFPFISEDNILYFSSDGLGGLGELDVFKILVNELDISNPENLGAPINSKEDDFGFIYSNYRNIGYVTSTRKESVGDADIYTFRNAPEEVPKYEIEVIDEFSVASSDEIGLSNVEVNSTLNKSETNSQNSEVNSSNSIASYAGSSIDTIKPIVSSNTIRKDTLDSILVKDSITPPAIAMVIVDKKEGCVQTVEGIILNENNSIMADATITLYENGQNIGTFDLSPDGKYSFELKCNHHYRVTARLNKFEESYFELRTSRFTGGKTSQNIILEKIPCDVLLTGKLNDIDTNLALSGVKVYLIENNAQINATQTDANGNYTFTVPCDGDFKIATDKFGYEERIFDVDKSSIHNTTILLSNVLTPVACEQIVRGRINNEQDGSPIINAKVELLNNKNEVVQAANSNNNGNFHFNISCETSYILRVSNDDFETVQTAFTSTTIQKENHRIDFNLKSTICLQTIAGTVINSRTKLAMNNVSVALTKNGAAVLSITTSTDGAFSFKVDCDSNYKISATTKDYSIDSKVIDTDGRNGAQTTVSIVLETKLDFEMVRDQLMIITNEIDFDLNQSDIREDAAIELNKVVTIMTRNPEIKVDIGVHTDSRAPDNYNLTLSEQRAQSILVFLIERGINTDRINGKGYGETQLLNKCANGVNCSETEHMVNRRIEFIVTR